jgi:hypothetical protein
MSMTEVISAPSSPWQNPFAERLIGSLRRECLDHVIILSQRHLRRVLARYVSYYHGARTHLALEKDAPMPRRVQPSTEGRRGRLGPPAEVVMRMLILKHLFDWSYDDLEREVRANLVYRMFTRIDAGDVPDAKTILKIAGALGPAVIEQLHRQVVEVAKRAGSRTVADFASTPRS